MKRYIVKIAVFVCPLLILSGLYVLIDPWCVIWNFGEYPDYKAKNSALNSYLLLTAHDSIPYNSFIVGSSRSWHWPWAEWEKHLDSTAVAFHLDQSSDGIDKALERLQFVYDNVQRVQNVLLIADHHFLSNTTPHEGIQYRNPWQMKRKKDYFAFQMAALRDFLTKEGMTCYFRLGEEYRFVLPAYYDERHEPHFIGKEWAIQCDPEYYYTHLALQHIDAYRFPRRDTIEAVGEPVLREENVRLLNEMHDLFVKGKTDYKIVISPLYDQLKLNPQDKEKLDSIFGEDNVYDFSGINEFTQDSLNYYEASHYRPCLSKRLLDIIYSGQ